MGFPLLADRFLPLAHALHLDVATGDRAWVRVQPATQDAPGLRWAERCEALTALWHPAMAECLDYGLLGTGQRFEAYRVNHLLSRRPGRVADGRWARDRVEEFLFANGLAPGADAVEGADASGRWLVVPGSYDADGAVAFGRGDPAAARPREGPRRISVGHGARPADGTIGVRLVHRHVYDALRERLCAEPPTGISVTDVEAVPGSGGRTLLRYCAREARRLGWVALATPALRWIEERRHRRGDAGWNEIVSGRHVVVLHDSRHSSLAADHELAAIVLRLGTSVPRPHRLIQLVLRPRAADVLTLAPLTAADLRAMIVIVNGATRAGARIDGLASGSAGLPGRFVEAALRSCAPPPRRKNPASRVYVVHDTRAPFGTGGTGTAGRVLEPALSPRDAASRGRPGVTRIVPGACAGADAGAGVWRAISESERLAGAGRHAAAERLLRQAGGAQVRRGLMAGAGDAALACGKLHVDRGRSRLALASFSNALSHYDAAGCAAGMAVASTWLGRAHLDVLDTDESEACLRAAVAGASLADHRLAVAWARVSLARTLWWLGRNDEAHALLLDPDDDDLTGPGGVAPGGHDVALAGAVMAVRVSWALGAAEQASAAVAAARTHAASLGTPASGCLALLARAQWCAALGDLSGLDDSVTKGLVLARQARRPLYALRLRIFRCHARGVAAGRTQAAPDLRALRRALARGLPELLAARVRLALAAGAGPEQTEAARSRYRARGLVALSESYGPAGADPRVPPRTAMIDDLIEVLRICQEEEDARAALVEVARVIQTRVRADAVVFTVATRRPIVVSWPAGGRPHLEAANRAVQTGVALPPQPTADATVAAYPVRCASHVIGAVACRWIGPPPVDPARAGSLLSAVAAAVAPAFRVLMDHGDVPALPGIESDLVGVSSAMEEVRRAVARAADAPYPVLVQAESGAGKELVARAIHRAGARRTRPFCALNCAALPDELIEAELFGHAKGAFTGAMAERRGLFEEADGGVLFLDEVGELSPRGQAKLLRVIQEGEIRRVGETMARRVDVRLVAATNRLLDQEVEAGRFRRDLWYRLDVIRIAVPPLRERPEDVPVLAAGFWRRASERVGSRAVLSDATLAALARYDWPGNVRELQNVLAALAVGSPKRGVVGPSALPATLARIGTPSSGVTLEQARRVFETRFVRAALARAGGHRGKAAAELGVTRQGLAKLMGRLGVDAPEICGATEASPGAAAGG